MVFAESIARLLLLPRGPAPVLSLPGDWLMKWRSFTAALILASALTSCGQHNPQRVATSCSSDEIGRIHDKLSVLSDGYKEIVTQPLMDWVGGKKTGLTAHAKLLKAISYLKTRDKASFHKALLESIALDIAMRDKNGAVILDVITPMFGVNGQIGRFFVENSEKLIGSLLACAIVDNGALRRAFACETYSERLNNFVNTPPDLAKDDSICATFYRIGLEDSYK